MTQSPWAFVPTLYLAEGFPYIIINTVSVILYGALGYSNEQITLWTSWLYLPWVLKMFWSPLVDARSTKRRWLLGAQSTMSAVLLALAGLICFYAVSHAPQANFNFFTFLKHCHNNLTLTASSAHITIVVTFSATTESKCFITC